MDPKIKQAVPKVGLETSSIEMAEGGVRRRATAIFGPKIREPQETIQIRNPRTGGDYQAPLGVNLRNDSGTWKVTVNAGYVIERNLAAGEAVDALEYHAPTNLLTLGEPTEFTVTNGDAVFVFVPETANGNVDGANVEIRVLTAATESTNHIETIQDGKYFYKLAVVTIAGSDGSLENFAAGGHIYHSTGLTADVLLEDCSGNQYEDPVIPGVMLFRLSFVSGHLAALNDTEAARPLSVNFVREQISPCTEFTEPP